MKEAVVNNSKVLGEAGLADKNKSESSNTLLFDIARDIGKRAVEIICDVPEDDNKAVSYYVKILRSVLSGETEEAERDTKVAAFVVFCLYQLSPWQSTEHESFVDWAKNYDLDSEEISYAWSFVKEFEYWEPGTNQTYLLIITLDRAIIRGARVGASSLDPQAFINWFERNYESFEAGQEFLASAKQTVHEIEENFGESSKRRAARQELEYIARTILRDVGRMYGRSGLNSVRRQIGAPPSARRPSHLALGALYSPEVYKLSQMYLNLSVSEREAFKCLLHKLDTGEPLGSLWQNSSGTNLLQQISVSSNKS
jgi:hypothetical protein